MELELRAKIKKEKDELLNIKNEKINVLQSYEKTFKLIKEEKEKTVLEITELEKDVKAIDKKISKTFLSEKERIIKIEDDYADLNFIYKLFNYFKVTATISEIKGKYEDLREDLRTEKNNAILKVKNHPLSLKLKELEKMEKENKKNEKDVNFELDKVNLKLKYIESNDKFNVYVKFDLIDKINNLEIYPSEKMILDINYFKTSLKIKYMDKLNYLEDEKLNFFFELKDLNNVKELKEKYIAKELERTKNFFDNIDGKALDNQQRIAVVTEEENNLVVAGAGSGKTLTIAAKVKYLIEKKKVDPKKILLMSFSRKAVKELEERIVGKLNLEVRTMTYHGLGLEVIKSFMKKNPEIFENSGKNNEGYEFENNFMNNTVLNNKQLRNNIFKYFTTYMHNYVDPENFDEIGDYYRANKSVSFYNIETKMAKLNSEQINIQIEEWLNKIKRSDDLEKILESVDKEIELLSKEYSNIGNNIKNQLRELIDELKNFKELVKKLLINKDDLDKKKAQVEFNKKIEKIFESKITFRGERVKSVEELIISNYFYSVSVDYEYEKKYPFESSDWRYKKYRPDFTLISPKGKAIYIEHFGINEKGKCPQMSKSEEKFYLESRDWKRKWHKKNRTILEETYSYDHKNGELINKLNEILDRHKIPRKPISNEVIIRTIQTLNQDFEYKQFYKLLNTFLNLFKSNNYDKDKLEELIKKAQKEKNKYLRKKHTLFLNIFKVYYSEYVKLLEKLDKIDFNDMINQGTNFINKGFLPEDLNFEYIILDEFQDISISKYELIKAVRNKSGAKVLAVGDDWQSIYRFTGSEISVFTDFRKFFGKTELMKIEKTYRNSQELIDIAGKFIMKNPLQIEKNLKSDKHLKDPIVLVKYEEIPAEIADDNSNSLVRKLVMILETLNKKRKTVMLLGRNENDMNFLKESHFFKKLSKKDGVQNWECKLFPNLEISSLTAHKSKGSEADVVIVVNNKNNLTGFPNKIIDDSIISYVIQNEENYPFAEERRLFYVAITRTRNETFLMYPAEYSVFISELLTEKLKNLRLGEESEKLKCPKCKTGNLIKKTNGKVVFYACDNYPQCNFTVNASAKINSSVRCPRCGSFMVLRDGKNGKFYGCLNFAKTGCKGHYSIEEFEHLENKKQ